MPSEVWVCGFLAGFLTMAAIVGALVAGVNLSLLSEKSAKQPKEKTP